MFAAGGFDAGALDSLVAVAVYVGSLLLLLLVP